jgi:two-component system response regulator HydG
MNVVQNMVLVCEGGELTTRHVPFEIRQTATPDSVEVGAASLEALGGMTLEQIEKQAIRNALRLNNGNREATAKMLGIGERTLYRKLREFGLK